MRGFTNRDTVESINIDAITNSEVKQTDLLLMSQVGKLHRDHESSFPFVKGQTTPLK